MNKMSERRAIDHNNSADRSGFYKLSTLLGDREFLINLVLSLIAIAGSGILLTICLQIHKITIKEIAEFEVLQSTPSPAATLLPISAISTVTAGERSPVFTGYFVDLKELCRTKRYKSMDPHKNGIVIVDLNGKLTAATTRINEQT